MRFLPAKILALAACASPALASSVMDVFTCLDPPAHCCDFVTSTGIGANCQRAYSQDVYNMLQINETEFEIPGRNAASPYVSFCRQDDKFLKEPQVAACCDSEPSKISSTLKAFSCLPPEEALFRYDRATGEIMPFGGSLFPDYDDVEDDDWYWYS